MADPTKADIQRHQELGHAIQTGVMYSIEYGSKEAEPKHLRTGLNVEMCSHAALVSLLVQKGFFTLAEYYAAMNFELAREVTRYEVQLEAKTGAKITLH